MAAIRAETKKAVTLLLGPVGHESGSVLYFWCRDCPAHASDVIVTFEPEIAVTIGSRYALCISR